MLIYLVIINIFSFVVYGVDKFLAVKHYYREKFLYLVSIFGGVLGAFLGMFFFRHKTLKLRFYLVNIISLLLWSVIMVIHLDSDVFDIVKNGKKDVEVKVNDLKRRKLNVGDTLIFLKRPNDEKR